MGQCVQKTPKGSIEFISDGPFFEKGREPDAAPGAASSAQPPDGSWEPCIPEPVMLNIYDLGVSVGTRLVNALLVPLGTGVFHCGVEVYGREWSYGRMLRRPPQGTRKVTGVFCSVPCHCEDHAFVKSVQMGRTGASEKEVLKLLRLLRTEWLVDDYSLLTHNCCHFCDDLCQRLGVGSLPSWAFSMSDAGAACVAHGDTRCCREVAGQTVQAAETICCRPTAVPAGATAAVLAMAEPAVAIVEPRQGEPAPSPTRVQL